MKKRLLPGFVLVLFLVTHAFSQEASQPTVTEPANIVVGVSDPDAEAVWGEAVEGLQLGISGLRQNKHFKPGDTIRFRLDVRNGAKKDVRFEYHPPEACDWVAPRVETADGKLVKIAQISFRGGHKHFAETLKPGASTSIQLSGILVLGISDKAEKSWPRIEKPEPGTYRLRGAYSVERPDADGERIVERNADGLRTVKSSKLTTGSVNFHID
jgi:hypothetical protein